MNLEQKPIDTATGIPPAKVKEMGRGGEGQGVSPTEVFFNPHATLINQLGVDG